VLHLITFSTFFFIFFFIFLSFLRFWILFIFSLIEGFSCILSMYSGCGLLCFSNEIELLIEKKNKKLSVLYYLC